ncbi:hypothetical protein Golomagni_02940 [Golovinomyces magnicellulatus]|nr:hypothetical protein Golomagni_02940 [Golovinomyces magnicellulatus]
MDALVILVQSCVASFKVILTSPEIRLYDDELYDELLAQWLQVRPRGYSVGLAFTQSINDLAILLTEIEITLASQSQSPLNLSSSDSTQLDSTRQNLEFPAFRSSDCSSYKKIENLMKLKIIIDDLEHILGNLTLSQPDLPPPYSRDSMPTGVTCQKLNHQTSSQETDSSLNQTDEIDAESLEQILAMKGFLAKSSNSVWGKPNIKARKELVRISEVQLRELRIDVYDEIIRRQQSPSIPFLLARSTFEMKRNKAREKLSFLPSSQIENLTRDILKETNRRYPELRVFSRQGVVEVRYEESDKFLSFKTKFTGENEDLKNQFLKEGIEFSHTSFFIPVTRRYGCILPPITPPPDLNLDLENYRKLNLLADIDFETPLDVITVQSESELSYKTAITHVKTDFEARSKIETRSLASTNTAHHSYCSKQISSTERTPKMFKSLNVSRTDQTSSILAATLSEYQIKAPSSLFALCIMTRTGPNDIMEERYLCSNEYPLVIYQELKDQGKIAFFLLKRVRHPKVLKLFPSSGVK